MEEVSRDWLTQYMAVIDGKPIEEVETYLDQFDDESIINMIFFIERSHFWK